MGLCDEARHQHRERQQPVIAAGQRPAEEDQQQERKQRSGGVPDVVEGLGGKRLAHQRDADGRREHQHEPAAPARQHDAGDDRERVHCSHRHRQARRGTEAGRQRQQPVEQRPGAVDDLAGHVAGLRILADERGMRGQHIPGPRDDDAVVRGRLPAVADRVSGRDEHGDRRREAGRDRWRRTRQPDRHAMQPHAERQRGDAERRAQAAGAVVWRRASPIRQCDAASARTRGPMIGARRSSPSLGLQCPASAPRVRPGRRPWRGWRGGRPPGRG